MERKRGGWNSSIRHLYVFGWKPPLLVTGYAVPGSWVRRQRGWKPPLIQMIRRLPAFSLVSTICRQHLSVQSVTNRTGFQPVNSIRIDHGFTPVSVLCHPLESEAQENVRVLEGRQNVVIAAKGRGEPFYKTKKVKPFRIPPFLMRTKRCPYLFGKSHLSTHNIQQLACDSLLSGLVVEDGQLIDQGVCIVACGLHGNDASTVLGSV